MLNKVQGYNLPAVLVICGTTPTAEAAQTDVGYDGYAFPSRLCITKREEFLITNLNCISITNIKNI